jgi:phosphoribosylamine---glycine ligase
MNILLIDVFGLFLDFALRCQSAGHEVRWFIAPHKGEKSIIGRGLVPRAPVWETSMNWADLVITSDNLKYIHSLESWRKRGYPIWGPNVETAQWELDRACGQQVFQNAGIPIMPSTTFKRIDEAMAFVGANPGRWVSKPNGEADKCLSYVSKGPDDLLTTMEKWKKAGTLKDSFILQKFVPGIEVAVGGWFGREGFSRWFLENFEHKKLMAGEIGPNTGEMGTVMRYTEDSELAERLLRPLEGELYRQGYTGYIDVAVIVSKQGEPLPLEFTTRPGHPCSQIQSSLHRGDPVEWIKDALEGRDTLSVHDDVATGVCIAVDDFPQESSDSSAGFPLYGWDKVPPRNFHPIEVMAGEYYQNLKKAPGLVSAGNYVCVVTGNAPTVEDSIDRAYANVDKLNVLGNPMWRTDIGERVECHLKALKEHGFCGSWKW